MTEKKNSILLAIESSCDDTSAAVMRDGILLSNVTASQAVHEQYGGVVPELASRAHQQNIVPVVDAALKQAGVNKEELTAIAVTLGPGLMGSLLVGVSFAKGMAAALGIPLVEVNHLHGHILAHFIHTADEVHDDPPYPFLCLLVSGGNSQIVRVNAHNDFEILGQTIDDAAAFTFAKPHIGGLDYSFSGLKTSFLYFLRDKMAENPQFIEENKNDLAASLEATIVDILMKKLIEASKATGIRHVALAGGVSANTALRNAFKAMEEKGIWQIYIPKFSYTTDNAAMIAMCGHYKYLDGEFCPLGKPAFSRTVL